jgi:branched-chain amino acid transport system ATP-binding protein
VRRDPSDETGVDLGVVGLRAGYGPTEVLFGVDLRVAAGETVALLGRNGAGKSTTLKAVMGMAAVWGGVIRLGGHELGGAPSHLRCRLGLGYVPQERRIFGDLSVEENLEIGRWRSGGAEGRWSLPRVYALFPALKGLRSRRGESLSGGEQQMLTIARTLMGDPRVLLLDEPSEGLAPTVVRELAEQIQRLRLEGIAILLSEQNLRFTLRVCDRAYVLDRGRVQWSGSREDLISDSATYGKYLLV